MQRVHRVLLLQARRVQHRPRQAYQARQALRLHLRQFLAHQVRLLLARRVLLLLAALRVQRVLVQVRFLSIRRVRRCRWWGLRRRRWPLSVQRSK